MWPARRKADLVRSLGADHVLDYATDDYLDGSTRYDLILDIGGRNPLRRLRRALTPTGTLVIVGGEGGGRLTGGIGRQIRALLLSPFVPQRLTFFLSAERQDVIERLAEHLERGDVDPAVGHRYPLEEAADRPRRPRRGTRLRQVRRSSSRRPEMSAPTAPAAPPPAQPRGGTAGHEPPCGRPHRRCQLRPDVRTGDLRELHSS